MRPFILVYGAPRTGTSLTMDLVKACGYSAGVCYKPHKNKRRGRNEHRLFGQDIGARAEHKSWKIIRREDMGCGKIIGFPEWIDVLEKKFEVRIIATNRKKNHRRNSIREMMTGFGSTINKIREQDRILMHRDKILSTWNGKVLNVDFDKLIKKDVGELENIKSFVDSDVDINVLMNLIDPDVVKFKEK